MMEKRNAIMEMSFEFALAILKYSESLFKSRKFFISQQLMKSGTSIGANVREAQNSESHVDFIHKMKISAKEAEETEYWLLLCKESDGYPSTDELLGKLSEIKKVLNSIISTMKRKTKSRYNPH